MNTYKGNSKQASKLNTSKAYNVKRIEGGNPKLYSKTETIISLGGYEMEKSAIDVLNEVEGLEVTETTDVPKKEKEVAVPRGAELSTVINYLRKHCNSRNGKTEFALNDRLEYGLEEIVMSLCSAYYDGLTFYGNTAKRTKLLESVEMFVAEGNDAVQEKALITLGITKEQYLKAIGK